MNQNDPIIRQTDRLINLQKKSNMARAELYSQIGKKFDIRCSNADLSHYGECSFHLSSQIFTSLQSYSYYTLFLILHLPLIALSFVFFLPSTFIIENSQIVLLYFFFFSTIRFNLLIRMSLKNVVSLCKLPVALKLFLSSKKKNSLFALVLIIILIIIFYNFNDYYSNFIDN